MILFLIFVTSSPLFATIMFRNSTQDGTKFYYQCQRFHPLMSWRICTKWDGDSSEDIRCPIINNWRPCMVKRSKDHKLRLRNFDARHGRIGTGAVVKNRKGLNGVKRGKGTCYQWKEKGQCSRGDRCSFLHESNEREQKPEHNAATPSEPSFSRGRSVSKKRSIQSKSIHGAIL